MFCSLHGKRPAYRAISTDKALAELASAVDEHRADLAMASDYIFNPDYFDDLVPALARRALPISIFYEVRPSLTKEQLGRLRDAGIDHFQAGIESFSTPLLRRVKKGSTGLQHVRFLKWAEELGLYVSWNILCGFPDADAADYEASLRLFPLLSHLAPTAFVVELVLQRYSPYFVRRGEFYRRVRPLPAYDEIFAGLDPEVVGRLAYSFAGEHDRQVMAADYRGRLQVALDRWKAEHDRSALFWLEGPAGDAILLDTRATARRASIRLSGLAARLYLACDDIRSLRSLQRLAQGPGRPAPSRDEITCLLNDLVEQGVMLREGASYLALALPLHGAAPSPARRAALLDAAGDRATRDALDEVLGVPALDR